MRRAHIEVLVVLAAVAHIFVAVRAAFTKPNLEEAAAIYERGRAAEDLGDYPLAAVAFLEIYTKHPYFPRADEAGMRLSRVLLRWQQDLDAAEEVLEMVADGYPGTANGKAAAEQLEFLRKNRRESGDEAVRLFFKALGLQHGEGKDIPGAIRTLEELVEKHGEKPIADVARKRIEALRAKAGA